MAPQNVLNAEINLFKLYNTLCTGVSSTNRWLSLKSLEQRFSDFLQFEALTLGNELLHDLLLWTIQLAVQYDIRLSLANESLPRSDGPQIKKLVLDSLATLEAYRTQTSLSPDLKPFQHLLPYLYKDCIGLMRNSIDVGLIESTFRSKLAEIPVSDGFHPAWNDSVRGFSTIRANTHCIFAPMARIWGASKWNTIEPFNRNMSDLLDEVRHFVRIANFEGLDGLVLSIEAPSEALSLETTIGIGRKILLGLQKYTNPAKSYAQIIAGIDNPSWKYSLFDVQIYPSIFSACYPSSSPRHTPSGSGLFIFFQPEESFERIAAAVGDRWWKMRLKTRSRFAAAQQPYDCLMSQDGLMSDAYKVILPLQDGGNLIDWWTADQAFFDTL